MCHIWAELLLQLADELCRHEISDSMEFGAS